MFTGEAVSQTCSVKKVFLEISQNSLDDNLVLLLLTFFLQKCELRAESFA